VQFSQIFITLLSGVICLFVAMPGLGQGHKQEIMRFKNSVPLCLPVGRQAFDPQSISFRDSSLFFVKYLTAFCQKTHAIQLHTIEITL
jgi:hypothetical protein